MTVVSLYQSETFELFPQQLAEGFSCEAAAISNRDVAARPRGPGTAQFTAATGIA
jgi:hypothetical protein